MFLWKIFFEYYSHLWQDVCCCFGPEEGVHRIPIIELLSFEGAQLKGKIQKLRISLNNSKACDVSVPYCPVKGSQGQEHERQEKHWRVTPNFARIVS